METEVDETMESYDVLLNLAMIDVEEDHYTFVQSLVWMLESCGYLKDIATDPTNETEVRTQSRISNKHFYIIVFCYRWMRSET